VHASTPVIDLQPLTLPVVPAAPSQLAALRSEHPVIDYAEMVAGRRRRSTPASSEQAARALFNQAVHLGVLGRGDDAIELYAEIIARFAEERQVTLRQLVAAALIFKGVTLGVLGRDQEAIAAYDELIARYVDSRVPALREKVAKARAYRRMRLSSAKPDAAAEIEPQPPQS
jgi:tetratricopeptide (TPR) repeat protein